MNILVIGSGGREHALCWAIKKSDKCKELYCAPGNAGIAELAQCENLRATDFDAVVEFCREKHINFVVIGPEAPLVAGLADFLEDRGIKVFGPSKEGAQLEASKTFTKQICEKAGIPTAKAASFNDAEAAKEYIKEQGAPIVVKADGLAAGKGVVVAETLEQALEAIDEMMVNQVFGEAGTEVLIEEMLTGREASFFVAVNDGKVTKLGSACDYKRAYDEQKGPNTGGMGTFSPADLVDEAMEQKIMDQMINPTLAELKNMGIDYKGFLFAGLMIDAESNPKLIEYNCRMGDPETQSIMPRLESDIVDIMLGEAEAEFADETAVTVVYAANGYPKSYEKNTPIHGLENLEDATVFHAGTDLVDKKIVNTGGRVLGITALGTNLETARNKAYTEIEKIDWPDGFYRKDIGVIYE